MNITAAKEQIKDMVEVYLQQDDAGMFAIDPVRQRPVFLLGAPGIGKTAIMEQIAQELGVGIVSYSMTHHTRQSALGLPRIVHRDFEGAEFDAAEYTMSEIVAAVYDYMEETGIKQGILFLDEINCVSETLYPSMLQFLQFKTFGRHRIPSGWIVACAGNPPEYNRSVHEFDIVTLDRLREIDVEPDYGSWKRYAAEKGVHPAVTTFLEAKRECFYKVESRPGGGKSFVTARGWEDLADAIAAYEGMGKRVDRDLIAQFLRDEDIADSFSTYYALFEKYRSDYQVERIMTGDIGPDITVRAENAKFDERIALMGLLLNALANHCAVSNEQEDVVVELRDALRAVKPKLTGGASVEDALATPVRERQVRLEKRIAASTVSRDDVRRERVVIKLLKDFVQQCALEQADGGPEAFATVSRAYKEEVDKIEPLVEAADSKMTNAFEFIEKCFGSGREMLVFMAELTTRSDTTQFVARHGNDKYYAHNVELQVDDSRANIAEKIEELRAFDLDAEAEADEATEGEAFDTTSLPDFYEGRRFEYGFASVCKMNLPFGELSGKRVLDICCRRGMGVYKLSALVGDKGHATGTDWAPGYIDEAKEGMERAWRDSHLSGNNMDFLVAYPEDLVAAGLGDATFDMVYVNNVMNLFASPAVALKEFARVLKPGGLLVCETVLSDRKRDQHTIDEAKKIGNSIQAAYSAEEFDAMAADAGFTGSERIEEYEVAPSRGYKASETVDTVFDESGAEFTAVTLHLTKG